MDVREFQEKLKKNTDFGKDSGKCSVGSSDKGRICREQFEP